MRSIVLLLGLTLGVLVHGDEPPRALVWDAMEKNYTAQPGETESNVPFTVTNRSDVPVEIRSAQTSCHCTTVTFPREPWILAPGASETLMVQTDLRSRRGGLTKTIYLDTSAGDELLVVKVQVPPPRAVQREMNLQAAKLDRQAVLRGDCASCHVTPAVGKKGSDLFVAACLICHGPPTRAEMVPDLFRPTVTRDAAYWRKWIREPGEPGQKTLMPDFAKEHGGPLDDAEIESIVEFVMTNLPNQPGAN